MIMPAAAQGQQVGGKDDDKIEAEARGKKSNKVTIRSPRILDLSRLPKVETSGGCYAQQGPTLRKLQKLDPSLKKEVEKELKATLSLRDRIVYLYRVGTRRERLIDLAEFGYMNKARKKADVTKHMEIYRALRLLAYACANSYLDILRPEKGAYEGFKSHYDKQVEAYLKAHDKNRADRRKKLGLPPVPGTAKPPKD